MNFDVGTYRAACVEAFEIVRRSMTPRDTGNLADNALQYNWEGERSLTFHMWVDQEIAPYMVYTNEPWVHKWITMGNFRPGETVRRFRTWDNPNEGWWNEACEFVMAFVSQKLKGKVKKV